MIKYWELVSINLKKTKMKQIKNEAEFGIRLNQAKSMVDIIQSKSLLNTIQSQGNENLHLIHESVLFATISGNSSSVNHDMKLLSVLGRFEESKLSEEQIKIKEKTQRDIR